MIKKIGRPTNEPKEVSLKVRLSKSDIEKLQYCYSWTENSKSDVIRNGIDVVYNDLKKYITSKELKRVFVKDIVGGTSVLFVDKNNKAYVVPDGAFDEDLTLDVAKSTSYANLAGCDTAESCQWCMGVGDVIDYKEDEYENITEF